MQIVDKIFLILALFSTTAFADSQMTSARKTAGGINFQFKDGTATTIGSGGCTPLDVVCSGTYTPVRTLLTNSDSVTVNAGNQFIKVGNIVTIMGRFDHDQTASGTSTFRFSLPVKADFTASNQANGVINGGGVTNSGQPITCDTTNDELLFTIVNGGGPVNQAYSYSASYSIKN